ncbi:MAG: AraC family transcriptional regulator [Bacteroidota bacterium]|nr:AraC family transcriptional regulator [Bacteroidota bacterium]
MKPVIRKSANQTTGSFTVKKLHDPHFDPNWHFHPEYQLFLVLEGTGTRFIGDSIKHFEAGDLVFTGPNLPHLWRSDPVYFEGNPECRVQGIVVYFDANFLGPDFFHKPEMFGLKHLLQLSERGLEITGYTRDILTHQIKALEQLNGFDRILVLLEILHTLSRSHDYNLLSSNGFINTFKPSDTLRMQQVHDYVLTHFKDSIPLETIAGIANMSPSAFCRYFKARANKTFYDFVSEIRIGYACKLLIEEEWNVTRICYECGYKTLSNFNHQFKKITGQNPLQYQKQYTAAGNQTENKKAG